MDKIRILLVDDEPDILRFLKRCLSNYGYEVQQIKNPVDALDLLNQTHFDLMVTDLKMPEMDGLSLLKRVKESSPAIEVVLMTGFASVETALGSMKLGAFDYLVKPFSIDEILAVVQRAVRHEHAVNDVSRFRDLDKMKEEFLSNVSHELRTPLSSITVASNILQDEFQRKGNLLKGEVPLKMISIIHRSSEKMAQMVDDLLETFRFQSGKVGLNKVPFSAEKIIVECVEEFVAPCQERGLDLGCEVEPELPEITADPIKLRQAILNLLANAMKFTPAGGKITIGARKTHSNIPSPAPSPTRGEGMNVRTPSPLPTRQLCGGSGEGGDEGEMEEIELFVRDTGVGIVPELQKKIFEKFYQVDGSTTRGKPGMGLGLALVKAIVEAHHGIIMVDSVPGKGSAFYLRIPTCDPSPISSPSMPLRQVADEATRGEEVKARVLNGEYKGIEIRKEFSHV